eukprot:CAMPEP_0117604920 /NCGR_PEP_ID=MMETSP0784-20121206/78930_1 /TAXON_ID=39447 /ORGANISM="" /LENGTH=791 /DNA_ID=CAMNT_0005407955 /DNA_START=37 /DNA_END=2412 /DNA_ORIENTATION=+
MSNASDRTSGRRALLHMAKFNKQQVLLACVVTIATAHAAKEIGSLASVVAARFLHCLLPSVAASLYIGYLMMCDRSDASPPGWQLLESCFRALAAQPGPTRSFGLGSAFASLGHGHQKNVESKPSKQGQCMYNCSQPHGARVDTTSPGVDVPPHRAERKFSGTVVEYAPPEVVSNPCTVPACGGASIEDEPLALGDRSHRLPAASREPIDLVTPAEPQSEVVPTCPSSKHADCVTDLNLVEEVKGLQGLKRALASNFIADPNTLPDNFRRGYVVDLGQHWMTVHAMFAKGQHTNSLSLIVFDTLEVDYQRFHRVGLLRSSCAESAAELAYDGEVPPFSREDDGMDVATLCRMRNIQYDISFLAPICDMRRLTMAEEDDIRTEKKNSASKSSTVYYDKHGNPFRKIIVQPILQAEQDGTCKSRALAALGWLLRFEEKMLAWYVASNRELFHAELRVRGRAARSTVDRNCAFLGADVDEDGAIYGSLMSTGKRDKFGRDVHLKVCHADTMRHNHGVETAAAGGMRLPSPDEAEALAPSISREVSLTQKRMEEMRRIREVLHHNQSAGRSLSRDHEDPGRGRDLVDRYEHVPVPLGASSWRWRAIEDHEARWQFLEETCFFSHNLGFRKIKKLYPKDEILVKGAPSVGAVDTLGTIGENAGGGPATCEGDCRGFGATKYLRKYIVSNNYITHEADPMFHQPLENVLSFLCNREEEDRVIVPFYVLPFPGCFMGLCLDSYVAGTNFALELEGDPDEHKRQKVSDYSLPAGNNFLNDPISYNKTIGNVSLPVKLTV